MTKLWVDQEAGKLQIIDAHIGYSKQIYSWMAYNEDISSHSHLAGNMIQNAQTGRGKGIELRSIEHAKELEHFLRSKKLERIFGLS